MRASPNLATIWRYMAVRAPTGIGWAPEWGIAWRVTGSGVQRGTRELQKLSLTRQAQSMIGVPHRLVFDPADHQSAPTKIILKRKLVDLRMQTFDARIHLCCLSPTVKRIRRSFQQQVLPLNDLIRMNIRPRG